ncbi:MAG: 2-hydroxyacyl-CoA dehydratase [Ignavibacteriae bacterium]|nr:2-hydroxyacyl-CoA dehydratase [Ignavibacteriota bacterium]
MCERYLTGIDIGSTTSKVVVFNSFNQIVFSDYRRHFGNIKGTLLDVLNTTKNEIKNQTLSIAVTGSAGMGISEQLGIPFVQELLASAEYTSKFYPESKTLIDIGGEDSKIIFFNGKSGHDIRMNSSCAGGTGAFIDQMAALLNISLTKLNDLARNSKEIYPIASRCGVFAKTDIQNLLSREIPKEDIAASVFHAIAVQIKNSLLHGSDIYPQVILSGGPLTFLDELRETVIRIFGFDKEQIIALQNPELLSASGTALMKINNRYISDLESLITKLSADKKPTKSYMNGIQPLFSSSVELFNWKQNKSSAKANRISIKELKGQNTFLGIDSGSTTTKVVLIDEHGRIAYHFYKNNNADPIGTVKEGLSILHKILEKDNLNINIKSSAVTGYGEELIKAAYNFDFGIVETLSHYRAAKEFNKDVTFILDIGGQDMKAIFVKDGIINNIEVNEACSSGCGSFIETFANALNYTADKFAEIAVKSTKPCDLGTRCTVFMNSKVKQSFREGAAPEDISAGLAYSVINNCLHKVLKIFDNNILGENIIVQGGTFKNIAVLKAFENVLGKKVINPDISELMGAYGAALTALDNYNKGENPKGTFRNLENLDLLGKYDVKFIHCKGCENKCTISKLNFGNGNIYNTGNRCEKIYTNSGKKNSKGFNMPDFKYDLLFNRKLLPDSEPILKIGIPRILNFYENFPFWSKLFIECGIEIVLSDQSSNEMCDLGCGTVMSENICYPAKIAHGHIMNLTDSGVDRIFYPIVTFEKNEFPETSNCYNCPVISGYPDVIRSSIEPEKKYKVKFDTPNINFKNPGLLRNACYSYIKQFGINKRTFNKAFKLAIKEDEYYKNQLIDKGKELIQKSRAEHRKMILLAGRPYQIDNLINHGIPGMISDFGYDVLTEDSVPPDDRQYLDDLNVMTQWAYPNRIYKVSKWAGSQNDIEYVQLNNFGCGPDTIVVDEVKEIIESSGKSFTLIRIDELTNTGSLKLRLRSLVESMKLRGNYRNNIENGIKRKTTKPFLNEDRRKTVLIPYFSPFHSAYLTGPFSAMGYKAEILPPSDKESVELGLKYVNNEICYPATLVIGDILKALKSGKYDISDIAVGITQTGGQCRASNYLPLIKKALVKTGYSDVPVVGITLAKVMNEQPGFNLSRRKITVLGITSILFGDAISQMYHAIASREKNKGDAWKIANKYNTVITPFIEKYDLKNILKHLSYAVREFNNIEINSEYVPKIGIVGEVYVKYNPMGNHKIAEDMTDKGIEVVFPPLINMFVQWLINVNYKHDLKIDKKTVTRKLAYFLEKYFDHRCGQFDDIMKNFKYFRPRHQLRQIAGKAEKIMSMSNHYFGEGWMIAGEILTFAEEGINNILCMQPFGCIANHIVARGVEKSIKNLHPELNLQFLDIDAGNSQVNIQNRLQLLVKKAEEEKRI